LVRTGGASLSVATFRRVPRLDVDDHVGHWGRDKGFMMPVGCLGVLYRTCRPRTPSAARRVRNADRVFSFGL
jgi:hypothetical protein